MICVPSTCSFPSQNISARVYNCGESAFTIYSLTILQPRIRKREEQIVWFLHNSDDESLGRQSSLATDISDRYLTCMSNQKLKVDLNVTPLIQSSGCFFFLITQYSI